MKALRNFFATATTGLFMTALALSFNACTESPLQSGDEEVTASNLELAKKSKNQAGENQDGDSQGESSYPQHAEHTCNLSSYNKKTGRYLYSGGNMTVPGGSTFHVDSGSLTPPSELLGQAVPLTMLVERNFTNNELIFTFGPSGCQFNPPAEVWFDGTDLNATNVNLYYIDESGNYVPQAPIERQGQRMKLYIDHFSTYALAAE